MTLDLGTVRNTVDVARELGLVTASEANDLEGLFDGEHPLSNAVALADSLHAHVKVDDVVHLPHDALRTAGAKVDNHKDGYIKYSFGSGLNLIFSSIDVSEDDLRETKGSRRSRPFLDHIGIDLRQESDQVKATFDAVPARAKELGWTHVPQGGDGKPVFCCHTHVLAKHWVFPAAARPSIELAYGPLAITQGKGGCDLRPSDPRLGLAPVVCGAHGVPANGAGGADAVYYRPDDLGRFGEIKQNGGALGDLFFQWYGAVFAEGALSAREKSMIALAVAHAVQCPYCIDAYTTDATSKGATLDQLTEAVHVAAAIRGGASLVHGMQMRGHVHRLEEHG